MEHIFAYKKKVHIMYLSVQQLTQSHSEELLSLCWWLFQSLWFDVFKYLQTSLNFSTIGTSTIETVKAKFEKPKFEWLFEFLEKSWKERKLEAYSICRLVY